MGTYNSAVITNGGQSMIAQAVAGASLEFTTIKTSSYAYPAGTNLATLTTINGIKQSKDITSATVYNSRVIKISSAVDNTGISTAYTINTIGIYAKVGSSAESLFAVVTASAADTMPAYDNKPYSYIYEINLTMQSAANVTVTVNAAGLVNVSDLNAAKVEIRGEIADLKSEIDSSIGIQNNIALLHKYNAVISSSNVWATNTSGTTQCVVVPVTGGESLSITHRAGITFHLAFLKSWTTPTNGSAPDFCSGYNGRIIISVGNETTTRTIPTDCRYVYILTLNNNADYSPVAFVIDGYDICKSIVDAILDVVDEKDAVIYAEVGNVSDDVDTIFDRLAGGKTINSFTLTDGYAKKNTGAISTYSGDGKYKRTDYIRILDVVRIDANFTSNADAGYAFYTSAKAFISGGSAYPITGVPSNAVYVILSNYNANATHTGLYATLTYKSVTPKRIVCCGDSVTEGMGMTDIGTAVYGGDCYPSHLLTMLMDTGINAKVYNYGHSGERSTEICARIGGRVCGYLGEAVTIPSNNAAQSLGVAIVTNYKVTGSKLYSTAENVDGTTAQLLFTKLGHDTRPLMIGDTLCNIYQAQQDEGIIQTINLVNPAGEEVTIPALSVLTTGSSFRDNDICIVYMGVNDGTNLTLAKWIDRCKSIIERNPKTLILGATNNNWTFWQGMTGITNDEKRAEYLNACMSAFGSYYLDLYDILTTKKCIEIAVAGGYLSDRTEAQITADNTAIAKRQTPPSVTLEGTAGEVHLNTVGYYVLAKSVYDKLSQLGLL